MTRIEPPLPRRETEARFTGCRETPATALPTCRAPRARRRPTLRSTRSIRSPSPRRRLVPTASRWRRRSPSTSRAASTSRHDAFDARRFASPHETARRRHARRLRSPPETRRPRSAVAIEANARRDIRDLESLPRDAVRGELQIRRRLTQTARSQCPRRARFLAAHRLPGPTTSPRSGSSLSPLTRTSIDGWRLMSASVPSICARSSGADHAQIRRAADRVHRMPRRSRIVSNRVLVDPTMRSSGASSASRPRDDRSTVSAGARMVTIADSSRYSTASARRVDSCNRKRSRLPGTCLRMTSGDWSSHRRGARCARRRSRPTTSSKATSPKNTRYEAAATYVVGHEERLSVADSRHLHLGKTDAACGEVVVESLGFDLNALTERGTDRETERIGPDWRRVDGQHTDDHEQQERETDDDEPPAHRSCPMLRRSKPRACAVEPENC